MMAGKTISSGGHSFPFHRVGQAGPRAGLRPQLTAVAKC